MSTRSSVRSKQSGQWRGVRVWAALMMMATVALSGCSDELDPQNPDDAYLLFRQAMFAGDGEAVWGRLDQDTHAYFTKSYEELVEMNDTIERYLPQSDHRLARRQSGTVLLREVKDGKTLFLKVFQPAQLPQDEAYKLGSEIAELNLTEDEAFAKVITKGGQEFYLIHETKDGQWYVMLLKSTEALPAAMKWVESNKGALGQTVDDLIAEERTQREKIIAELMGF